MYVLNDKHMLCNKKQEKLNEKHNIFKTLGKMQNHPTHIIFYSQDEWHQGYNNKTAVLSSHGFARGLLQVKTENINFVK